MCGCVRVSVCVKYNTTAIPCLSLFHYLRSRRRIIKVISDHLVGYTELLFNKKKTTAVYECELLGLDKRDAKCI